MPDDWSFRFSLPNLPKGKLISADEAEALLLDNLKKREEEWHDATWELARFYSTTGRQQIAFEYMERLIASTDDLERKAACYLSMGQIMEQIENFEAAVAFYSKAFSLEPMNTPAWYLINNNLGYCLNHFGRYTQAESYCRAAISIDPQRYNAYKNLGISQEGQGNIAQAARQYISAVRANASDARALRHLEKLVAEHPEISLGLPDINELVNKCRQAVELAARVRSRR